MSCKCENDSNNEKIQTILKKYPKDKNYLIQILNEIQETYGYIPKEIQLEVSNYLDMPMAEIYGVITFYSRFTLEPKGKYNISVCLGTACFVKGSEKILDRFKEKLGIDVGGVTPDRKIFNYRSKMYRGMWISTSIYNK